ncbi:MAG: hypothetical protein H0Z28_03435 [Archaeoglobus sp.]|nr:hypothetical protein [Archaeoglobus sp.]
MRKVLKFGIGMLIAIATIAMATAATAVVENENGKAYGMKAYEMLEKAELESYGDHYIIVVDGERVGVLWKDVKLEDVTVGEPFEAEWGVKAPLLVGKEVVGQIFVEGKPFGWMHSTANSEMNRYGWQGCSCDCSRETQYGQNEYGHMYGHGKHGNYGEWQDIGYGRHGQYGQHNQHGQHGQDGHNHVYRVGEGLGWQNSVDCEHGLGRGR